MSSKRNDSRPKTQFGGAPLMPPEVVGQAVGLLAQGMKQDAIVRELGIGKGTVHRIAKANQEAINEMQMAIQQEVVEIVLDEAGAATRARLEDAKDTDSRTGAQSFRVAFEAAGLIGRGDTHIHGDVNLTDARAVHVEASELPPEIVARIANSRELLGF